MIRFNSEDIILVLKLWFQHNSITDVRRKFLTIKSITGRKSTCYKLTEFRRIVDNFLKNGVHQKQKGRKRGNIVNNLTRDDIIATHFNDNPTTSLRKSSVMLEMSVSMIQRTAKYLKLKPYKSLKVHKIENKNKEKRETFAIWFNAHEAGFEQYVLWSDEKCWVADSSPNSQNDRFWSMIPPNELNEVQYQGKERAMCWVGILNSHIIGPFWFCNDSGESITVNQRVYLEMLKTQMLPALNNLTYLRRVYFQQDGASCHCTDSVLEWLKTIFNDRIISRRSSIPWPPQSPDLSPLDYWLWGRVQSLVNLDKPKTIQDIKVSVASNIQKITRQEVKKSVENIRKRLQYCEERKGEHFQHLL